MISRLHRFHGRNSLRYVHKHGEITRGQLFSIKSIHNERRKTYRLAVVVSKKVSKSAVKRNRIRRRLYEQVRLLEPQIAKPFDLVIMVYSEQVATMSTEEMSQHIHDQLTQAHVLSTASTPVHGKIEAEGE